MTLSKPEFDFSKYVKVPEEWLEKALDVPNTVQKAPKAMPPLHRYLTAASIVLVAAIGVTSYFFFRNNTPITVAPLTPSETAVSQTETTLPATEYPIVPGTDAATHSPTITPSQPPTQGASDAANTPATSPSPAPSGHPTETPAPAPTTAPTAQPPTASPTVRPTTPTAPTEQMPTEPKPTEPKPAEPKPTELQPEPASAPETESGNVRLVRFFIRVETSEFIDTCMDDDSFLYCLIRDSSGNILGNSDIFSDSHIASMVTVKENMIQSESEDEIVGYLVYNTYLAVSSEDGSRFTYEFYTNDGIVIRTGSIIL